MDRDILSPGAQPTPCSSALCSLHSEILGSVPSHSPQGSGLSTLSLNAWLRLLRLSPRSRHSWVILILQFLAWALPSRAGPPLHGPRSRSTVFHLPSPFMVSIVQPTIATLPVYLFIHRTLPLDQKTHFLYHHCTCPCLKLEKKVKLMFRRRLLLMERRNQLQIKWESCTREMKIWQKPSFLQLYGG